MTLCDFEKTFEVTWLADTEFSNLGDTIESTRGKTREYRLLFIGTQLNRVYLIARNGVAVYVPFTYQDGGWFPMFKHQWKVDEWDSSVLESEESFRESLERQMLLQFPDSVTGYYDTPPTYKEVLKTLSDGDTVEDLKLYRFTVYLAEVQEDPEWDGAVQVICDKGVLLIPYTGEDERLVIKYATYVPDSTATKVAGVFSSLAGRVSGVFGNMHWSNFRYRINQLGGKQ